MPRTDASLVEGILLSDYDGSASLTPFITWANLVTTRVATCATNKSNPLSAEELEMIERYLAAHAYAMTDRLYASKRTGNASATYQGKTNMMLEATSYGQMALSTDPSGCLSAIAAGRNRNVGIRWLGKTASEALPWDARN